MFKDTYYNTYKIPICYVNKSMLNDTVVIKFINIHIIHYGNVLLNLLDITHVKCNTYQRCSYNICLIVLHR